MELSFKSRFVPSDAVLESFAGTSVRTFQRQLARLGMNYSELVQQVRLEAAIEVLDAGREYERQANLEKKKLVGRGAREPSAATGFSIS